MADGKDNKSRDAILALFLLSSAAIAAFADAIYQAQMDAAEAAYTDAADAIGADASDFTLPDGLLRTMAKAAQESAQSIVTTYNESITREAANYTGDVLHAHLAEWAKERADWKSSQVSMYETSKGYSSGIDQMVSDILAGDLELPDNIPMEDLVVTVLPDVSSPDECADYAGQSYPLSEADDVLSMFPAHANCIHWCEVGFAT